MKVSTYPFVTASVVLVGVPVSVMAVNVGEEVVARIWPLWQTFEAKCASMVECEFVPMLERVV